MVRTLDIRGVRCVLYGCIFALSVVAKAASAAGVTDISTVVPAPPLPTLTAVTGGNIEPHSDYVRLTYISAKGETTGSAEAVYSAGTNTLTVVHSPPQEAGAVGYNIYAVKNNAGSGLGHSLQNSAPLAIGTDFTEPANGWIQSRLLPPISNSALIPLPEKTFELSQAGGYFEAPVVRGAVAALVFPSADSRPTTDVSISTAAGLPTGLPQPTAFSSDSEGRPIVLQTISFSFKNDITFAGFPTFKLTLPRDTKVPGPYQLLLYDGVTNDAIALVPGYFYRTLTFLDKFNVAFHAIAHRRYYAELIANSPNASTVPITAKPTTIKLPSTGGISLLLSLPASKTPIGAFSVYSSVAPPTGFPRFADSDVKRTALYTDVMLAGTATYSEPVTLTVTLPQSMPEDPHVFKLAAYDSEYSQDPWAIRIAPERVDGRTITFTTMLPPFLAWRQYGFALYISQSNTGHDLLGKSNATQPQVSTANRKPIVFVIGDSISLLTILPPSSAGCVADWGPIPNCQYSNDPRLNWPSVFAQMTGDEVVNVSNLGTQTTVNSDYGESMLSMMVPQVPADADVVVCQCGVNDLSLNHESPATSVRAAEMTKAILDRAPHARIVYVGIRCFIGCGKAGVAAWNDAFRDLASKYGAFVDLIPFGPDGASGAFPDGSHPTPVTARSIAMKIAEVIATLKLEGR